VISGGFPKSLPMAEASLTRYGKTHAENLQQTCNKHATNMQNVPNYLTRCALKKSA
jgi:hypothetical protein